MYILTEETVTTVHPTGSPAGTAHPWIMEHKQLKVRLIPLHDLAEACENEKDSSHRLAQLKAIREEAVSFMKDWDDLLQWEKTMIFPKLHSQIGGKLGLVSVMMQDHVLAKQYFQTFHEMVEYAVEPMGENEGKLILSFLQQTILIIADHFRAKEEQLFPIADSSVRLNTMV